MKSRMMSNCEAARLEAIEKLCAFVGDSSPVMRASIEEELGSPSKILDLMCIVRLGEEESERRGGEGVIRSLIKLLSDNEDNEGACADTEAGTDITSMSSAAALAVWKEMELTVNYGIVVGIYRDVSDLADHVGKDLEISRREAAQLMIKRAGIRYLPVNDVGIVLLSCGY